jgi:hypothetical protein
MKTILALTLTLTLGILVSKASWKIGTGRVLSPAPTLCEETITGSGRATLSVV